MSIQTKQIIFTSSDTAELLDVLIDEPTETQVMVELSYTAISAGTEKANLHGLRKDWTQPKEGETGVFPVALGYSGCGTVLKTGAKVSALKPGDKVVVFWGKHKKHITIDEKFLVKIPEGVALQEAALSFISVFSLAALRKTKFEVGESVVIMGLGILGLFAVKLARMMGAYPIVAVDPIDARRKNAIQYGADYAVNPFDENYAEQIKAWTNGGANVGIEVTGLGKGLEQILECMAPFGRVALLGCTRNSDFSIDFYNKVHRPGIQLIGAHTEARPEEKSYPHYWTHYDDISAVLNLLKSGRLNYADMICEIHNPETCTEVYSRLAKDTNFPIGVLFDWSKIVLKNNTEN
jgi:2-desacetyl-2-hydroxyethyl bacteriochlorophyllide A dehydrogenase